MKEKQPTVLEVTDVRNMDVPELKSVVCCDNPATGECLNVCYLEDGGKRVLSLSTDAVPRPMRPSGGGQGGCRAARRAMAVTFSPLKTIATARTCATDGSSMVAFTNLTPNPHQIQHSDFSRPFCYFARSG